MIEVQSHKIVFHYINGILAPPQSVPITPPQTKMQKALQSYQQGAPQKLILRGIKMREIPDMPSLGSLWEKIKVLDLSEMGLKCLMNLPEFRICRKLDCTMNYLDDSQVESICEKFKAVETVYLTENWIKNKSSILMFKELKALEELDFTNNPVKYSIQDIFWQFRYKEKFIILDRTDRNNKEIDAFYYDDGDGDFGDGDSEEGGDNQSEQEQEQEQEQESESSSNSEQQESEGSHKKKSGDLNRGQWGQDRRAQE